ncbi:MAG TPA: response regulator transcription factor [Anaerolineae bacterium]|nr:response regulator transcription factor [Anaerolineae bacterium]
MRVLVADDHSLFRDGIVSLLEAAGFEVVGQVGDGSAAVEAARRLRPDLVLMDISMPRLTGLEALRAIRAETPDAQVVMLTVSDEDSDLFEAIRAGARGFLLKSLNAREFIEALEGLKRGEAAITRQTAARLMDGFAKLSGQQAPPAETLTPRELELLQYIVDGLSNKAIAEKLSLSENTVKYHIKNILQKLGAQNRTEAATHALRDGLLKPSHTN